jgi:hypothetical protein
MKKDFCYFINCPYKDEFYLGRKNKCFNKKDKTDIAGCFYLDINDKVKNVGYPLGIGKHKKIRTEIQIIAALIKSKAKAK